VSDAPPPVFFDPERRRWRRVRLLALTALAVLLAAFGALLVNVAIAPAMPKVKLAAARTRAAAHHPSQAPSPAPGPAATAERLVLPSGRARARSERLAFFVNWDDTSLTSLKENVAHIDRLVPEWLHLASEGGAIALDDPFRQTQVLALVRGRRPRIPVVPLLNNFDAARMAWEGEKAGRMLADPAARRRAVAEIGAYVDRRGFEGICVDLEKLPAEARPALVSLVKELRARLAPRGAEVLVAVPLDDPRCDYRALAEVSDALVLMAYDEHSSATPAGPVASRDWYVRGLARRFAEVDGGKLIVGLGNYGYDWSEGGGAPLEITYQEAIRSAGESEGRVALDLASKNPTFDYDDEKETRHRVFFLDAVTVFDELKEGRAFGPRGFALWRLGSEDPSVWNAFDRRSPLDGTTARSLVRLHYGYDIDYEGKGEILSVTSTPRDGVREVDFDAASGLVVAERLSAFPSSYVITRHGEPPTREIAITFDDGPDAAFTPRVLDVLARENAPATFFVIGYAADVHPELLRRMWREGHEIGNHTFTHPDISTVSRRQLELELTSTERLLESAVGRRSLLFRAPYSEDTEPETPDQVEPLVTTSALGYYAIGMRVDPKDWMRPGADQIVRRTLDQARRGQGRIVLLHDGGGDRTQTIAALPRVIRGLREAGFTLVTVSRLLGLSRETVMPPLPRSERLRADASQAGFTLIQVFAHALAVLFAAGIALGVARLLFIGTLAVVERLRSGAAPETCTIPSVAAVVPAFNEERVIVRTVEALLASDVPRLTVIVVDDGSSDATSARVADVFADDPRVRLFTRKNGGKARALNYGISQTDAEVVVALDADTLVAPDAIRRLLAHFADSRVGAVAGNAKVGNRVNLLTRFQALEYVTSQNLERRAFDLLDCITVVPGAIGAWRRGLVLEAGGFPLETLAEDADLTLTIRRAGYHVRYEDGALGFTEAPDTGRGFLKQRFRWTYGTLQAACKHLDVLFRRRYGSLGFVALPNLLVFQVLLPLLSPVADLHMLLSILLAVVQRRQHPLDHSSEGLARVALYYGLFLAIDLCASLLAFCLEKREDFRLLGWLFLQRFVYRVLMNYVAVKSIVVALRGSLVGWGKLERKATVVP
jgi:cellulose synthase/poly-beta-1,6-N-acetylglucosamine synthase-like glycosyltransferase/peptidoglycan/xylan/chitin deacetylase (PgdA/CDA1 family)/spore germination protein YaaH